MMATVILISGAYIVKLAYPVMTNEKYASMRIQESLMA